MSINFRNNYSIIHTLIIRIIINLQSTIILRHENPSHFRLAYRETAS